MAEQIVAPCQGAKRKGQKYGSIIAVRRQFFPIDGSPEAVLGTRKVMAFFKQILDRNKRV